MLTGVIVVVLQYIQILIHCVVSLKLTHCSVICVSIKKRCQLQCHLPSKALTTLPILSLHPVPHFTHQCLKRSFCYAPLLITFLSSLERQLIKAGTSAVSVTTASPPPSVMLGRGAVEVIIC